MSIEFIVDKIAGKVVTPLATNGVDVKYAMASDLMSDVLTLDAEQTVLITGLANLQTLRTAEMSDIHAIILVRNKKATPEMLTLAEQSKITVIESPFSMFRVSGVLFEQGIKPLF